jgi:hypothetical protein
VSLFRHSPPWAAERADGCAWRAEPRLGVGLVGSESLLADRGYDLDVYKVLCVASPSTLHEKLTVALN